MMKYVLFSLLISFPMQFFSDYYVHFCDIDTRPGRYYFSCLCCGVFSAVLFTFRNQAEHVILAVPLLILAAETDLRCGEIPDLCAAGIFLLSFASGEKATYYFLATFLFSLVFSINGWMGFGDTKLISAWAFFRGERIIPGVFFASLSALLYFLPKHREKSDAIAFAPFLTAGFLLAELIPIP